MRTRTLCMCAVRVDVYMFHPKLVRKTVSFQKLSLENGSSPWGL